MKLKDDLLVASADQVKQIEFKARPVNKRILYEGPGKLPQIDKKISTGFEEF